MNYNVQNEDMLATFGGRYLPPYWQYTVLPRVPEDGAYIVQLDFGMEPLSDLVDWYQVENIDILEVFRLDKRLLVTGVNIQVAAPVVGVELQPVTNSGVPFDVFSCAYEHNTVYVPFGGTLDSATALIPHSFRVEEPDYLGLKIISGADLLSGLILQVSLAVSDTFTLDTISNSTKDIR